MVIVKIESNPATGKHLLKKRDSIKGLIQDLFHLRMLLRLELVTKYESSKTGAFQRVNITQEYL